MRSVYVSHIVLTTKELADVIYNHLKEYDNYDHLMKAFAKLAKKYSACGTRNKGGDLGCLEVHIAAPELYQAAMKAPVRQIQGPVQTKFGYHVFIITQEDTMGDLGIDGLRTSSLGSGDGTL